MEVRPAGRFLLEKAAGAEEVIMSVKEMGLFVTDHFGDTDTLSVPRKTFLALGGYPTDYSICEDVFFLTRLWMMVRLTMLAK